MMADKYVPRRSDRLTEEEKVNHTKRTRATNELQVLLDHPAPASRKKKPKAAPRMKKNTDQLARVNFTNAGRGRILKVENMLQEESSLQEKMCVKVLQLL